jgi:hypothetical protein
MRGRPIFATSAYSPSSSSQKYVDSPPQFSSNSFTPPLRNQLLIEGPGVPHVEQRAHRAPTMISMRALLTLKEAAVRCVASGFGWCAIGTGILMRTAAS